MSNSEYDDIIDLTRPASSRHPPMPRESRAAQFAAFAALTGYDACVREEARLTGGRIELTEDQIDYLNRKLACLAGHLDEEPSVTVTYFRPDKRKQGGAYLTVVGGVHALDELEGLLILDDRTKIPLADILSIESELFDAALRSPF